MPVHQSDPPARPCIRAESAHANTRPSTNKRTNGQFLAVTFAVAAVASYAFLVTRPLGETVRGESVQGAGEMEDRLEHYIMLCGDEQKVLGDAPTAEARNDHAFIDKYQSMNTNDDE